MHINEVRERVQHFIDTLDDERIESFYTLFKSEIESEGRNYEDELKQVLDSRYNDLKTNGNTISQASAQESISKLLKSTSG